MSGGYPGEGDENVAAAQIIIELSRVWILIRFIVHPGGWVWAGQGGVAQGPSCLTLIA